MATTDYAALEDSIIECVRAALGLPEGTVYWSGQGEPPQLKPFAELREANSENIGEPQNTVADNPGGAPGEEIILTTSNDLEMEIDVFIYTVNKVNLPGNPSAAARAKAMVRALGGETNAGIREGTGLVFVEAGKVLNIPRVLETQFEGRATVSLKFRVEDRLEEKTTFIETVELEEV